MRPLRTLCLTATALGALVACASTSARQQCRGPRQPDELEQLSRIADSAATNIRLSADTMSPMPRRFLQGVVDRVVALDGCGMLRTPEALRDAASALLAARTLGTPTVARAYGWAREAVERDSADRRNWRVMAQSWDQLQVLLRQPQWFATVVSCATPILGRCSVAPLDSSRVSEALRLDFGLPSLKQQQKLVDSLNRMRNHP